MCSAFVLRCVVLAGQYYRLVGCVMFDMLCCIVMCIMKCCGGCGVGCCVVCCVVWYVVSSVVYVLDRCVLCCVVWLICVIYGVRCVRDVLWVVLCWCVD